MATGLTLHIAPPHTEDGGVPGTVYGKVYPVTPAASSLEARQNALYTRTDGRRITIPAGAVVSIEEDVHE